jgi:hypothetical protein
LHKTEENILLNEILSFHGGGNIDYVVVWGLKPWNKTTDERVGDTPL